MTPTLSLVTVTLGREADLSALLDSARQQSPALSETIVVFNGCGDDFCDRIGRAYPEIIAVRLPENLGAVARSEGMAVSGADVVVTLDDDVRFVDSRTTARIIEAIEDESDAGAIAFRVVDPEDQVCNWVFRRPADAWSDVSFDVPTFPGGAVAFRRAVLDRTGLYPLRYFISGEEDDLAVRILDAGARIVYRPEITVRHGFASEGRADWRRDYYDLRNSIWFAARHYPVGPAMHLVVRRTLLLGRRAASRGHLRWTFRAWFDALRGLPSVLQERKVLAPETQIRLRGLKGGRL